MKKNIITVGITLVMLLGSLLGGLSLMPVSAADKFAVSGKLTDSTGAGMQGVLVTVYDSTNAEKGVDVTDSNGEYTVNVEAGTYTIEWKGNGAFVKKETITVNGAMTKNAKCEIEFRMEVPNKINVGDIFEMTFVIENNSSSAFGGKTFEIVSEPTLISVLSGEKWTIPAVQAGKTFSTKLKAVALVGGSENVGIKVDGVQHDFELFVSGSGWYAGDSHTHSDYFDGKHSIRENVIAAREMGLDWLYSTDHNMLPTDHPYKAINLEYDGKFVNLMGTELTIWRKTAFGNDAGHMISYRVNKVVDGYVKPGASEGNNRKWQSAINNVKDQGGIIYMAHPNDPNYGMHDSEKFNLTNYNGVEIINWASRHTVANAKSILFWDAVNSKDISKFFAINNSDAHERKHIGMVYNKGNMSSLSVDNVNNMLETGFFYGTNGPDMRFELGGAEMGQVLNVNGTQTVRARIMAYDSRYDLKTITLYRMDVTGDYMGSFSKTPIFTVDVTGQGVNYYETYLDVKVKGDEIYRLEVTSELAHNVCSRIDYPTFDGFAFSNPVWVENAAKNGITQINSVKYNGSNGSVVTNGKGEAFILMSSGTFDINSLTVTPDSRTTVTKTYTAGGNGKAGKVTLTLKAADGTTRTKIIYVVSPSFV